MDVLAEGEQLTSTQIVDAINDDYLSCFENAFSVDESTVRKKLKEYVDIGLLRSEKQGREVKYSRAADDIDLNSWNEAVSYFSEEDPLGVIGSYVMSRTEDQSKHFGFKHHYILHALDSEILCELLLAIDEKRAVELTIRNQRTANTNHRTICPLKIFASTQSGRQYLLGYHYRGKHLQFYRVDSIERVELLNVEKKFDTYLGFTEKFEQNLWGVSSKMEPDLDHVEMTIHVKEGEQFILQRLEREKRHGTVSVIDNLTYRFEADVYDALELLPWLRTFIGRVEDLKCSNNIVVERFYEDIAQMQKLYGGDDRAV